MVFDNKFMFFDGVAEADFASGKTSAAIENGEGGDAADPLFLAVCLEGGTTSAAGSAVVLTSDTAAFTASTTLATYPIESGKGGLLVKAKLPFGCKKYLKVTVTATADAGTISAGLVQNVPND